MALERIYPQIVRDLLDPDTSEEDRRVLLAVQKLINKNSRIKEVKTGAAIRRERQAEEARATGERVGVPLAQFLAERGVTTVTPVGEVVPDYKSNRKKSLMGVPILSGRVEGLELEPVDLGLAIKALNVLGRAAKDTPSLSPLTMEDIHCVEATKYWAGPHLEAILQTMAGRLPSPPSEPLDSGVPVSME